MPSKTPNRYDYVGIIIVICYSIKNIYNNGAYAGLRNAFVITTKPLFWRKENM